MVYPDSIARGVRLSVWLALAVGAAFLFAALTVAQVLHPLNIAWARLALGLHHMISPIALGLLFFLVFSIVGLVLRAFGKDMLHLRQGPNQESYWIARTLPGPTPESMRQQF